MHDWFNSSFFIINTTMRDVDQSAHPLRGGTPPKGDTWLLRQYSTNQVSNVSSSSSSLPSGWLASLRRFLVMTSLRASLAPPSSRFRHCWKQWVKVKNNLEKSYSYYFCIKILETQMKGTRVHAIVRATSTTASPWRNFRTATSDSSLLALT